MGRPRAVGKTAVGAMKNPSDLLDELLPMAEPSMNEMHKHAALLEVGEPAQLLELAADTARFCCIPGSEPRSAAAFG